MLLAFLAGLAGAQPKRILYVTTSAGYRHASIETSIAVLQDLSRRTGQFEIVNTEDVSLLNAATLQQFDGVLFFTSGELPVTDSQKSDLLQFVQSGKGFMGVHSATDTFYTWPEYGNLIGAWFNGHPWVQPVRLDLEDPDHPATAPLRPSLALSEEIYQFRGFSRSRSRVLMSLDSTSIDLTLPGVNPGTEDFPSAWCHLYGSGRVFYTALGHFDETWKDERFQRLLVGALLWITRQVDGDAAPRNPDPPAIAPQGVGNSATLRPPMVISAGSWFTIFGTNLTAGSALAAGTHAPLAHLAGTVVQVNGAAVPLSYASPSQINAYLPLDAAPRPCTMSAGAADCSQGEFDVTVSASGGGPSHSLSFPLIAAGATPGVFATTLQNGRLTILATGLGPVILGGSFQITRTVPAVRVGSQPSRVLYSGLAPGWPGIYEVSAELPANLALPLPVEFCFGSDCQPAGWICDTESRLGRLAPERPVLLREAAAAHTCNVQ